ncbi:MAG: MBL fold metallo-hydrolase [Treponema sp.]|jgi:glyoxylase-like metal-dependent hydrolase (beta-lactamase superfamily II)|nr:MBL fold metallo-hydrolase [Treponema sp.]
MKIYFHLNLKGFSNCYVVVNEQEKKALIIDPGQITADIINQIEGGGYKMTDILITHNHESHVCGLKTLMKIYTPTIYAADWEVAHDKTTVISGEGTIKAAGLKVEFSSLPGHSADSIIYKIGCVLFTGDVLSAGIIGKTSSKYAKRTLRTNIRTKILSQADQIILMPGHGPPSTIGAERKFNIDLNTEEEQ